FDTLAMAGSATDLADPAVELKPRGDLAAQGGERGGLGRCEGAGKQVEDEERAECDAAQRDDWSAGIKPVAAVIEEDTMRSMLRIQAGILYLIDRAAQNRR